MKNRATETELAPRKTPRQRRSAETVGAIVEAAARILETEGLGGYSTNTIAERGGVSIGSLYQYFGSKDAITGALIARETRSLMEDMAPLKGVPDGRAGLERMIDIAVFHQFRRPALARLLDMLEERLPLADQLGRTAEELRAVIQHCLNAYDRDIDRRAVEDILAVVRAMVDSAARLAETDLPGLRHRVGRAVFGYLDSRLSCS
ncbi:TetR/AcrR family transcriptional regulator [uncultured Sphingomonas sp.]|uniref:TetR/AcrR family transcriptional regulator n=1 Tax=uncultured Sphingomonas sp. TaxID=158754 RepID=UPI0035CA1829